MIEVMCVSWSLCNCCSFIGRREEVSGSHSQEEDQTGQVNYLFL